MDYKDNIEQLKKSCRGKTFCEIDKERLEAAQIIDILIEEKQSLEIERNKIMSDIHGICYLCKKGKPFRNSKTIRMCEHFKNRATNKERNCPYFEYRLNKEEQ